MKKSYEFFINLSNDVVFEIKKKNPYVFQIDYFLYKI